jgi:hypothetical protein
MTLDEMTNTIEKLCRISDELEAFHRDWPRRDEALQHIRWAIIHLSEKIWLKAINDES